MQQFLITEKQAGQRLDRYLGKLMPLAPRSFFYKMMRKKNIVLNGKKAQGMEKLKEGDTVSLFLADQTIQEFGAKGITEPEKNRQGFIDQNLPEKPDIEIIYEDKHVLIFNKPVGMLSQKAKPADISAVEHMIAYLLQNGSLRADDLSTFRPGICNRLDRNTSGLLIAGKTIQGLQVMSALLKERSLDKFYLTIISGHMEKPLRAEGYLKKDHDHNRVMVTKTIAEGADFICTEYEPLACSQGFTLLKVKLVTGKSHQIRAHLKDLGFPVIGDGKYGDPYVNQELKQKFSLTHHLLHAYEIKFPTFPERLGELSGRVVKAPLTEEFKKVLKGMSFDFKRYI